MNPDFQRDGYQVFPGLFSKAEIAVLRAETARLSRLEEADEGVLKAA